MKRLQKEKRTKMPGSKSSLCQNDAFIIQQGVQKINIYLKVGV